VSAVYSAEEKRRALADLGWEVRQAAETAAEFFGALMSGQREMPHGSFRAALLHQRVVIAFLAGPHQRDDVRPDDFVRWVPDDQNPDLALIRAVQRRISKHWMHLTWQGVRNQVPFRIVGDLLAVLRVLERFENELMQVDSQLANVIRAARQEAAARLDALDDAEYEWPS
jgi:hypothetical protein